MGDAAAKPTPELLVITRSEQASEGFAVQGCTNTASSSTSPGPILDEFEEGFTFGNLQRQSSDSSTVANRSCTIESCDGPLEVRTTGHEVWLHVYDLGPVTGRLNEFVLRGANLGAFHCGVEVLENEWCFQGFHDAWDDPTLSGVIRNEPRLHPGYVYRESIFMGDCPFSEEDIDNVIDDMMDTWPANSYHLLTRNCVTFAEEFSAALNVPEPFPTWVRGAADAGKSPALFAIADYGWSWFKWWSKRQAEKEAEELEAQLQQEGEEAALSAGAQEGSAYDSRSSDI